MKQFKIDELVKLSVRDLDGMQSHILWEMMDELNDIMNDCIYDVYRAEETNVDKDEYDKLVEKANKAIKDVAIVDYNYGLILEAVTLKEYGKEEDDYDYYPKYYASLEAWKENKGKKMKEELQKDLDERLIK